MTEAVQGVSLLTDQDIYLFKEGTHFRLYDKLGAHLHTHKGAEGTLFALWAPNAFQVSVVGDFNGWDCEAHPLVPRWDGSGIWEGFVPGVGQGMIYKYFITSSRWPEGIYKGDPFAYLWECPPKTASVVWDLSYGWNDSVWMGARKRLNGMQAPFSTYEVHLGSWKRLPEEANRSLHYCELAQELVEHVDEMGFSHVEMLPVHEHPFFGSWGYQAVGYFAPSSRYGTPQDFMGLIDAFHQKNIGVILDWVPSHFPLDSHGLAEFDGSHLFEHQDPRQGFHPDWNSAIFNYGRNEVRAFLISSALFWLDRYHVDGLRVDAVASMLYLDYSRQMGQWIPNRYGGRENLEAIDFLRSFNQAVHQFDPDVRTIAEESTAWPNVSRPVEEGGLGFDMKWKMGWMHDTLKYFSQDPIHRRFHHDQITFSIWYAYSENFVLPLSHDEVVHGKGSLMGKLPGDGWQRRANLRLLLGHMYSHPGKKLLFMGAELGQWSEWNHDSSLQWHLLDYPTHRGLKQWLQDLNRFHRQEPALHRLDFDPKGYEWVDLKDRERSIVSYLRLAEEPSNCILAVCNFTPDPRPGYRVGVPQAGQWEIVLNSDAAEYGGSDANEQELVSTTGIEEQGRPDSILLDLPPLGILFLKRI